MHLFSRFLLRSSISSRCSGGDKRKYTLEPINDDTEDNLQQKQLHHNFIRHIVQKPEIVPPRIFLLEALRQENLPDRGVDPRAL